MRKYLRNSAIAQLHTSMQVRMCLRKYASIGSSTQVRKCVGMHVRKSVCASTFASAQVHKYLRKYFRKFFRRYASTQVLKWAKYLRNNCDRSC